MANFISRFLFWGRNYFGQLGDGTLIDKNIPTIISSDNNWVDISSAEDHCLALKSDGSLYTWGYNYFGQLGDGTNVNKLIPTTINCSTLNIASFIDKTLIVFPNPVKSIVNIKAKNIILLSEILDINGRNMMSTRHNNSEVILNIEGLQAGFYFLKVTTKNGIATIKISKV